MFGLTKKKGSVLGVDVGSRSVKIAQLQFDGTDRPRLVECTILGTGTQDETFSANLRTYISEHKLSRMPVACSIDDPSLKIRKVQLPKMPHADLIEAVKWKLRDNVDGDIEQFTITYSRISEQDNGEGANLDLMAYAIKKEAVQNLRETLERAGLSPFYVEPSAVTLASTLERCYPDDDNYESGVDIGYSQSIFYVIGKGTFVFSRPLHDINLSLYEKNAGEFPKKLAIEIQKSIDTFAVNFQMESIKSLYLSGGGALIPGISDYLQKNMGIDTSIMNPFKTLSGTEEFESKVAPPLFAQAIGLAYLQP